MGEFARSFTSSPVSTEDRAADDLPENTSAESAESAPSPSVSEPPADHDSAAEHETSDASTEDGADATEDQADAAEVPDTDSQADAGDTDTDDADVEDATPTEDAEDEDSTSDAAEDSVSEDAEENTHAATTSQETDSPAPDHDSGLSGFFDTLDERARTWWVSYRARRAEKKRQAQMAAEAARHAPPKPAVASAPGQPAASPRHAQTRPHFDHVPSVDAVPQLDGAEAASSLLPPPPHSMGLPRVAPQNASPEDTTVLPAYSLSPPPPPPRVRHALDEQRRRDVIVQKARAIEDATAEQASSSQFADDEEDLYTYIPPYNLPSRDADPEPTRVDLARRIAVSVGALAALLSTFWVLGWFGTSEENPSMLPGGGLQAHHSEGWFSGEYALLSPDYAMYWLWPVITLGMLCHAGFQWTATQVSTPRQRRSGWMVAGASLLMLPMTAAMHFGLFTVAVLSSVASALMLTEAVRQFNLYTARTSTERRLTDGVVGLFFGFALVQAGSAVSVWLTVHQWHIPGIPPILWAGIGLLICVWTAAYYSMTERGRITIALGLGWGMFWLIFPRLLGEATSVWVAIGAAMAAFIVILSTQSRRHRINHAERRAAMGRPLGDII